MRLTVFRLPLMLSVTCPLSCACAGEGWDGSAVSVETELRGVSNKMEAISENILPK